MARMVRAKVKIVLSQQAIRILRFLELLCCISGQEPPRIHRFRAVHASKKITSNCECPRYVNTQRVLLLMFPKECVLFFYVPDGERAVVNVPDGDSTIVGVPHGDSTIVGVPHGDSTIVGVPDGGSVVVTLNLGSVRTRAKLIPSFEWKRKRHEALHKSILKKPNAFNTKPSLHGDLKLSGFPSDQDADSHSTEPQRREEQK
ncbi:hypothetical protein PoB_003703600 [Plakobranchus ocellatus]|uniref:Uncharacterized protein n=1 Tax=Plakobranchus ocellatus TaxID=259542 RepID=A0AAV4AVF9_9GAST|nr:hypothetical protein PoB_003703600 [Plakobranchus ocellatus]